MRVIMLMAVGDSVDEVLVVDDKDEQEVIDKLADENAKLGADERIRIHSVSPIDVGAALDYIRNP